MNLDSRFTFDAFVVGPANRLAVAAARRVAESPGASYSPLFIYSGSGLGKTHLLTAIAHEVARLHGLESTYRTAHELMDEIAGAIAAGERDALRSRIRTQGVVLLDDVQFLAGQRQVQDELIRSWDEHLGQGGQVVLTSDRPPHEIDGLDDRLVSRLSGGLIVDMAAPDYETRAAIARRKADEMGQPLAPEVYQVLARIAFNNVRELQGALNRLMAVQQLEGRRVAAHEVGDLLGAAAAREIDEFGEFLSDVGGTVGAVVDPVEQSIGDAILEWEGQGFRTRRLDAALADDLTSEQAEALVRRFEEDVDRLRAIESRIRALDPASPELGAAPLRDPDRVADAERLLAIVQHRETPPPAPPPGGGLDTVTGDSLALRAARAVAVSPGTAYNPLYVLAPAGPRAAFLAALGNELARPGATVAFVQGDAFAAELIDALAGGRVDAWRARYRRSDALVLDGLEGLADREGAHDQLFQLFEDLHRRRRQLVFAGDLPPQELPLPERLRSRLESGLVVELGAEAPPAAPSADVAVPAPAPAEAAPAPADAAAASEGSPAAEAPAAAPAAEAPAAEEAAPALSPPAWMLTGEKVLWEWPYRQHWIQEPPD